MSRTLERLLLRIEADTAKVRGELQAMEGRTVASTRKMELTLGRTGVAFKQFGRSAKLAAAAAAAAFAAVSIAAVKIASDVEEMGSKFQAVFKDQAVAVEDWAERHAKAVNRSKFDLMGYLATVQDTFVPLGFARAEAADFSKQLVTLAVDLASFNNESEPEVVQALTSAIIGNHEAVRRFGVVITQATLEQELFNQGVKGGVQSASNMEKVLARLAIIMRSTGDAQGDAARTAGSFANTLRGTEAAANDLANDFGEELLPAARQLLDWSTEFINRLRLMKPELVAATEALGDFFEKWRAGENDAARSVGSLQRELDELNKRIAVQESTVAAAPGQSLPGSLRQVVDKLTLTDVDWKRLEESMRRRDEINAVLAQRALEGGGNYDLAAPTSASTEPAAATPTGFSAKEAAKIRKAIAKARKEQKDQRDEALKFLTEITRKRLQAADDQIAIIKMEEQADLDRLETLKLSEEEKAKARVDIQTRASTLIGNVIAEEDRKAEEALKKLKEEGEKAFDALDDAAASAARTVSNDLVNGLLEGQRQTINLQGVLGRLASQLLEDQIFGPLFDAGVGLLKSAFAGGFSSASGVDASNPRQVQAAQGRVFDRGRVVPFASGGVVDRPLAFPLAGGTGLVGERYRPEVIAPLARMPGGDMGIRAQLSASPVNVVVNNNTGAEVEVREFRDGRGGRSLAIQISDAVATDLRNFGPVARELKTTYGLTARLPGR